MREQLLEREQFIPAPIERVFARFGDVENLELITPPWLRFRILDQRPTPVQQGTIIEHRLWLHGVPIRWRTLIERWDPPHGFTDSQLRGPYGSWSHTHSFTPVEGGTIARDTVRYRIGYGPIGDLAQHLFVARDVESIFDYRRDAIHALVTGDDSGLEARLAAERGRRWLLPVAGILALVFAVAWTKRAATA